MAETSLRSRAVSVERLRELLDYDPETGALTWKEFRGHMMKGTVAGCLKKDGYLDVIVCKHSMRVHRAAWAIHYGEHPKQFLDHINGIKTDNRIANLRLCTPTQNNANTFARLSMTGFKGVYRDKRGRFRAAIGAGKTHHLGTFDTPEEAAMAYDRAALRLFGEFANLNLPAASQLLSESHAGL